jgi:hypothetical protein
MAKDSRRKARAGTTSQSVAKEVVACLAAHTGLPQADFRNKHKVKRFAAGGKRRGALIRALLAWPALKQLALRQQDFDKAELSGKSTVGDIIGIISAAAKAVKPPAKKRAAKKRTSPLNGTARRPVKAPKTAKAAKKAKQVAPSKLTKEVVRKSKAPKRATKTTAPRRIAASAAPESIADSPGPIGTRATGRTIAPKPRLGDAADTAGPSSASGPVDMAFDANGQSDNRADRAAEPQAPHVDVLLRDADKNGRSGPHPQ